MKLGMLDALDRGMEHIDTPRTQSPAPSASPDRRVLLGLASALAIVAFFILREHWAHALGLAPYLLLLACPLMHLFGHRHHGYGDERSRHRPEARH